MALAPRSSLRSLVLLVFRRKPWLSSFSSSPTAVPPLENCIPAAPSVQPPSAPALPDSSSYKCPPHEELPLHPHPDPPKKSKAIIKKSSPFTLKNREHGVPLSCTVDQDPKQPIPASSTTKPVPYSDNPGLRNSEGVDHPLPDPPRKGNAVIGKSTPEQPVPLLCTVDKDPKHPTSEGGSYSSTSEPVPGSDKPRGEPRDGVGHEIPDPPIRTINTVLDNPVLLLCTVDEDPKHQTPNGGSYSSTPAPDKAGHENVKHPLPDPPRRP